MGFFFFILFIVLNCAYKMLHGKAERRSSVMEEDSLGFRAPGLDAHCEHGQTVGLFLVPYYP